MAVSVNGFAKKSLRTLSHLAEPVSGNEFTGVGIRIGERENFSFEIFYFLKMTGLVDNQIGLIKMAP